MDFDTLFDQCYPPLFRYCNRLTGDPDQAADVAQEAFVRLLEREVDGAPAALRVWLFKVATHLVRDQVRVRTGRVRLLTANPVTPNAPAAPDESAEKAERVARVRGVLDTLDPRDRAILLMKQEGFRYKEIAEAIGVAPTSVGTLLARAQKRFRDAFEEADATSG